MSFGSTYTFLGPTDPTAAGANGFQNLDTTFKYRLFKSPEHEFVMSVGLSVEWGGTGAESVGAETFHHYTPNLYFGKGLGDLPDTLSWIRPVAITGQVGYSIPEKNFTITFGVDPDTGNPTVDTQFHPRVLNWGGTIQYSMPYLKSAVIDLGLPEFINHLIPLVEATLQTPVANTLTSGTMTTGTINPGVIWVGNTFQIAVEALIPINRQSGTNVGVIAQLHLYLDDIDPRGEASAHAFLDRAEPRVGNKVASAPHEVTLWFTQKLEAAFSTVTVTNAAGERVDTGKARISGTQMSVSLRPGGSGTYHVTWQVLSVDTHRTNGSFTFQVGQ